MMKKYLFLGFIALLVTSCATLPKPSHHVGWTDYSQFRDAGIFVTESPSVSFPYESLGSVSSYAVGGWVKSKNTKRDGDDSRSDIYGSSTATRMTTRVYTEPDTQTMIADIVSEVKRKGGDGVINLEITYGVKYLKQFKTNVSTATISGMVIRRK